MPVAEIKVRQATVGAASDALVVAVDHAADVGRRGAHWRRYRRSAMIDVLSCPLAPRCQILGRPVAAPRGCRRLLDGRGRRGRFHLQHRRPSLT